MAQLLVSGRGGSFRASIWLVYGVREFIRGLLRGDMSFTVELFLSLPNGLCVLSLIGPLHWLNVPVAVYP
jgi:hypothetical protein